MVTEESIRGFFAGLFHLLTQREAVFERQIVQFFADLEFRLKMTRTSKRHLDRYLASDFDVFRYISPDENRLSDILADLLDPDGLHGQRITTIARPIIDAALTETGTGLAIPPMGEP